MWLNNKSIEAPGRLENLKELINALRDFSNMNEFLEHISLVMENERNSKLDMVNMHSAKGLEFENVFLAGWDEGLFPHQKSLEEKGNESLEEERRLAYVGITRGKKNVFISFAKKRFIYGTWNYSQPSRFLSELPKKNIDTDEDFFQDEDSLIVDEYEYKNRKKNLNQLLFRHKESLTDNKNSFEAEYKFKIGDEIFHERYGYGKIKYIVDGKYEIIFDRLNETKIVLENFIKSV